ncbi:nucleobindin-2 isoform X3 [Bradysia coprophila]|uniref:nucleobindin-2 isoform X3 n=1 Tax=Bradysia coprophila TaxID=38358 RepID=UPI00187D88DB|nr:nucleobindin-2 isoform X3 [Bradysia coprophila]
MRRIILLFFVALSPILSLPVTKTTKKPVEETGDLEHNLEYERYLKEIVEALESDPEFRQKLNNASEDDIRSGNIAHELEYVNHQVRTRLDEIKREEMERLRQLINKQYQLNNQIDEEHLKVSSLAHVDHENMHTFEIKDLQKLITKLSEDLNAADKKRREEFKQYELEKEFEKQEKLRGYGDDSRAEHEAELKKLEQKHNEHPKVHHPGNKAQLEEVWEEQDHMEGMDFDPQTFFMMHDIDSNGVWDQNEVKALFVKELDKVYQQGLPEDDMRERAEEMERMREHVFTEADRNRDGVIDYQEFIDQTKKDEFQRDPGWDTVDTEKVYTHDEYLEFERRRQEEINRMMAEHPEKYPNYHQDPHHQQNYNQHLDQQHVNQQQQYQNQQQNQNQQFQQQNQIPQQQYQNQQQQVNQVPQQNNNQQQFQQPPPQQQQHNNNNQTSLLKNSRHNRNHFHSHPIQTKSIRIRRIQRFKIPLNKSQFNTDNRK